MSFGTEKESHVLRENPEKEFSLVSVLFPAFHCNLVLSELRFLNMWDIKEWN